MKNSIKLALFCLCLLFSCSKEDTIVNPIDAEGVVVSRDFLWKKSLHEGEPSSNSYVMTSVVYGNNLLVPTTNNSVRSLSMINKETGGTLWKWDERFQPESEYIDIFHCYINNNLLTWQNGKKSYCINLDNGTTKWKSKRDSPYNVSLFGQNNEYYTFGESVSKYPEYSESVGFKGDLQTGNLTEIIMPNFTLAHINGGRIGDVTCAMPCVVNGTPYLAVIWQELAYDNLWDFQSFLGLYNEATKTWLYEKQILNQPNVNGVLLTDPIIFDNKIYANIGKEIVCHDLATGNQVWKKDFEQDFMFSGFLIVDNKLIGNCEDTKIYCLNAKTGGFLWKIEGAGTSSAMSYLNGVVYFVGGSTGKLHAIDIATGKTIWKIKASNLGEPENSNFKTNAVYVFPAENGIPAKVIALTYLNAYCFEAAK